MRKIGERVQLHPATSAWMQGDRFGEVVRVVAGRRGTWYHVRLDRSGRVRHFHADNVLDI